MAASLHTSTIREVVLYPGLEALPILSEECYKTLTSNRRWFPHQISPAVFDYYIATLSYCRLLYLHKYNGGDICAGEQRIVDTFKSYKVPPVIAEYLSGFGNLKMDNISVVFQMLPRNLIVKPPNYSPYHHQQLPSHGWFGRIHGNNHYLYAMYPSLVVYFKRIVEDLRLTLHITSHVDWGLPYFMNSLYNASKPTQNLLGYKPTALLRSDQVSFLENLGITANHFNSGTYPVWDNDINESLMSSVYKILNKHVVLYSVPTKTDGLKLQIPSQQVFNVSKPPKERYLDYKVCNHCTFLLPPAESYRCGAFTYRLQRRVSRSSDGLNPWCIFEFNQFNNVPETWRLTANTARMKECDLMNKSRFISKPYSLKERINYVLTHK